MEKEELLQQIKNSAEKGLITKGELIDAYNTGAKVKKDILSVHHLGVSEILYFIGGAIVSIGISMLIWQNWEQLNIFTKIIATLGAGIASYFVGVLFSRYEKLDMVGQAFYFISALVMPLGLYVVFDNAGLDWGSYAQTLVSGILFATYLLSYFVFRRDIFIFFNIIFGTWLFFSFTNLLLGNNPIGRDFKLYEYRVLFVGLSYMLLGYYFSQGEKKTLSGILYGFGVFGFLAAALALGGWSPQQNVFWEIAFPGIVFVVMFLSVYLKNRSFLTFGALYLMGYILKITGEYFTKGLGWPLSLVVVGLSLILVGYFSFSLNKKYMV